MLRRCAFSADHLTMCRLLLSLYSADYTASYTTAHSVLLCCWQSPQGIHTAFVIVKQVLPTTNRNESRIRALKSAIFSSSVLYLPFISSFMIILTATVDFLLSSAPYPTSRSHQRTLAPDYSAGISWREISLTYLSVWLWKIMPKK